MEWLADIGHTFLLPGAWLALLTLAFMEIVPGIDNIVVLSLTTGRLPEKEQPRARVTGLALAMVARVGLLFGISLPMRPTNPFFSFHLSRLDGQLTGQSLIILVGGLFLLYKSVSEIRHRIEGGEASAAGRHAGFWGVIAQVVALDVIFSFDSAPTATGMVSFDDFGYAGAMAVMTAAILAAVSLTMFFSGPVSRFVNRYPILRMPALSFLIPISVMLIVEAARLSNVVVFGREVGEIPKEYIYFAIASSLGVEVLNTKLNHRPKPLRGCLNFTTEVIFLPAEGDVAGLRRARRVKYHASRAPSSPARNGRGAAGMM